jgi:subtilisin family serine protease
MKTHMSKINDPILTSWQIGASFKAYHARLSQSSLDQVLEAEEVLSVEHNSQMKALQSCQVQNGPIWNLDRISEHDLLLDGEYNYPSDSGNGVTAYIIDTGIRTTHREFEGRATWGANFADNIDSDCNGHGTHVAGTVAGKTYGVAKKASVVAVKVLDCDGSGTTAGVISGIEYTTTAARSTRKKGSVANMSLGGGRSTALDNAVTAAIADGITFSLAAGNENQDACNVSPARVPTGITVGATTVDDNTGVDEDTRSYFSNFGLCVDLFAPGQLIASAWNTSDTAIVTISGTSMAAPHVAGVVALVLGIDPTQTPAEIREVLVSQATSGLIELDCTSTTSTCNRSPNLLLYSPCS